MMVLLLYQGYEDLVKHHGASLFGTGICASAGLLALGYVPVLVFCALRKARDDHHCPLLNNTCRCS